MPQGDAEVLRRYLIRLLDLSLELRPLLRKRFREALHDLGHQFVCPLHRLFRIINEPDLDCIPLLAERTYKRRILRRAASPLC